MTGRPASRREHQKFCQIEGWVEVRNARGKATSHHVTYELDLADGRILRTRISRPPNTARYGPSLWQHILVDQLDVTEAQFWACIETGRALGRVKASDSVPANALPADLAYQLVNNLGLTSAEIEGLTLDDAVGRLQEYWSRER